MSSVITDVLATKKLLLRIFSHSTREANASNLLVNKTWADEVLNVEWNYVHRVDKFLGLLAPLIAIGPNLYAFHLSRSLEASDWDRFYRYGAKVKHFVHGSNVFDSSVYETLSQYQEKAHASFLPNLRYLCCIVKTDALDVFLPPQILSLTLTDYAEHYSIDRRTLELLFLSITRKCSSSLKELYFNCRLEDDLVRSSESVLISAFRELRQLREITIYPGWLSERAALTLAGLPALATLNSTEHSDCMDDTAMVPVLPASLNGDSFAVLNNLALVIRFEKAIPGFLSWGRSTRLRSLYIVSYTFESPEMYGAFVKTVVRAFPFLQSLSIDANAEDIPLNTPTPRLTFWVLEPILHLKSLLSLKICYTTPLHLLRRDMFTIFSRMPYLTSLELNPRPAIQTPSSLHLTCLSAAPLAGACIQDLCLYVDTSPNGFDVAMDIMERLHGLSSLNVGYSSLSRESVGQVVEYLSQVLPKGCIIEEKAAWEQSSVPSRWKNVDSFVPALTEARQLGDIGEVCRIRTALNVL